MKTTQRIKIRKGTQTAKLLKAYYDAAMPLIDEEAAMNARVPIRSCWWKRCSELRQAGLIKVEPGTKKSSLGKDCGLSVITFDGIMAAREL